MRARDTRDTPLAADSDVTLIAGQPAALAVPPSKLRQPS
jgi:hypothetical protein